MKKARIEELEVVRAIAFIFVLIQHTIGGYSISENAPLSNAIILRFIYSVSKSAVPMFIFISALSLFYTYSEGIDIFKFYKKRVMTFLLPYICCTFIYIIALGKKVDNIFISLINGNTVYHLWYIGTSIRIYLFFPIVLFLLIKLRNKSFKFNLRFIFIFTLISFMLITNKDIINDWGSQLIYNKPNFYLKEFMSISPIYYSLYFLLGYYFSTYLNPIRQYISKFKISIMILFAIFIISNYLIFMQDIFIIHLNNYLTSFLTIGFNISSMFFWYLLGLYILKTRNKIINVFKVISHYSFGGYLLHVGLIQIIASIFYKYYTLKNDYIFPSVTFFILTLLTIIPLCYILSLLPFSKYIFGVDKYRTSTSKINQKNINVNS